MKKILVPILLIPAIFLASLLWDKTGNYPNIEKYLKIGIGVSVLMFAYVGGYELFKVFKGNHEE